MSEECKYSLYKFPEPQYLGSKYVHHQWIAQFIPDDAVTVLDAFAGSQSIAYMLKQMDKSVITNDFLMFNHMIGKALIENTECTIGDGDLEVLFSENSNPREFNLMETLYSNLFFLPEEARFLDAFRSNVRFLNNEYKEALALVVMCRSMTRKVTMGHFAHLKALEYMNDPVRVKRNRSLTMPLKEVFMGLLPSYNAAVFDNGQRNVSLNKDVFEVLQDVENVDVVYFDPPYCGSHADYQSFYHLLETYVQYWKGKQFVNGTKRYEPKIHSGFDKRKEIIGSLKRLFMAADKISTWLVSYNDRSYPDIETMHELMEQYHNVRVETKNYKNGRGGKGSVAGSNEVLFVCTK